MELLLPIVKTYWGYLINLEIIILLSVHQIKQKKLSSHQRLGVKVKAVQLWVDCDNFYVTSVF